MNKLFVFTSEKISEGSVQSGYDPIESKNGRERYASMQTFTSDRKERAVGEKLICLTTGG